MKEFAKIDGAFVIRDDGVILSCGTYITGAPKSERLHSGLGARHTAALSITTVTGAFAVAISESTRKITVFHAGKAHQVPGSVPDPVTKSASRPCRYTAAVMLSESPATRRTNEGSAFRNSSTAKPLTA